MNNDSLENTGSAQETLTNNLVELGRVWARHGLSVGVSALEASAKSLSKTATLLGEIVEALEAKAAPRAAAAAASPEVSGGAKVDAA